MSTVGDRLGEDVALNEATTLRAYRVTQTGGALRPNDHRALRWVTADELRACHGCPRTGRGWASWLRHWLREIVVSEEKCE